MERRILEAIVEQQQIGAGGNGGARRGDTVAADPGRCGLGQQQRLVADVMRFVLCRLDAQRSGEGRRRSRGSG